MSIGTVEPEGDDIPPQPPGGWPDPTDEQPPAFHEPDEPPTVPPASSQPLSDDLLGLV